MHNTSATAARVSTSVAIPTKQSAVSNRVEFVRKTEDPVKKAIVEEIVNNQNTTPKQKREEVKRVVEDKPVKVIPSKPNKPVAPPQTIPTPSPFPIGPSPIVPGKVPGLPIAPPIAPPSVIPTPPSNLPDPQPSPPSKRPLPPNLTPAPPKPKPPVVTPSPPVTVVPTQPKTSVRPPEAIVRTSPRVYSQNRRVAFRASRLSPPRLNLPPRRISKAKPKWKVAMPSSRSFMRPIRPGQFSFQRRGQLVDRRKTNAEINRLKRRINELNADALRTKSDHEAERALLEEELRDYRLSPLTQIRNQAKGVFEVVDKASGPFTPSVNGMDGFPEIGEGTSKALAAGMALFAGLFLIGRVE